MFRAEGSGQALWAEWVVPALLSGGEAFQRADVTVLTISHLRFFSEMFCFNIASL